MVDGLNVEDIVAAIRGFPGVTRKAGIEEVVARFPTAEYGRVLAAEGEDAAVIDVGEGDYVLFSTDGMMESLVR